MHLPLGHPAGDRDDRAAQLLGAVVRAQAAGEQPVPVRDVHHVAGPAAGGADGPGHQPRPGPDVVAGVADDGRPAGGAGGGVHPRDLLAGHGEHAERVVVAQVRLVGERELRQVGEIAAVVGVHAGRVERGAVVRHVARTRAAATSAAVRSCSARSSSIEARSIGSSSSGRGGAVLHGTPPSKDVTTVRWPDRGSVSRSLYRHHAQCRDDVIDVFSGQLAATAAAAVMTGWPSSSGSTPPRRRRPRPRPARAAAVDHGRGDRAHARYHLAVGVRPAALPRER